MLARKAPVTITACFASLSLIDWSVRRRVPATVVEWALGKTGQALGHFLWQCPFAVAVANMSFFVSVNLMASYEKDRAEAMFRPGAFADNPGAASLINLLVQTGLYAAAVWVYRTRPARLARDMSLLGQGRAVVVELVTFFMCAAPSIFMHFRLWYIVRG